MKNVLDKFMLRRRNAAPFDQPVPGRENFTLIATVEINRRAR
jgi:hypothetical protein